MHQQHVSLYFRWITATDFHRRIVRIAVTSHYQIFNTFLHRREIVHIYLVVTIYQTSVFFFLYYSFIGQRAGRQSFRGFITFIGAPRRKLLSLNIIYTHPAHLDNIWQSNHPTEQRFERTRLRNRVIQETTKNRAYSPREGTITTYSKKKRKGGEKKRETITATDASAGRRRIGEEESIFNKR